MTLRRRTNAAITAIASNVVTNDIKIFNVIPSLFKEPETMTPESILIAPKSVEETEANHSIVDFIISFAIFIFLFAPISTFFLVRIFGFYGPIFAQCISTAT